MGNSIPKNTPEIRGSTGSGRIMVKLRFVREFGSDTGPHSEGAVVPLGLCRRKAPHLVSGALCLQVREVGITAKADPT